MIEQAEQFAEEDRKRRELAEELNNADSVCYQAERTLADYGAKIGEDLRQRIEAALREARGAVAARDAAAAKQTAEALKSLLLEVGRTVYSGAQAGAEPHVETAGTHEAGGARVVDAEFKQAPA